MKVAIHGYYPPPLGGISIHIKRFSHFLQNKSIEHKIYANDYANKPNSKNVVYYSNRKIFALKYFLTVKEDIIHTHMIGGWNEKLTYSIIAKLRRKKSVITLHSLRDNPNELSFFQRTCLRLTLKLTDGIIVVSGEAKEKLIRWGYNKKNIRVIPAFLPPSKADGGLPGYVNEFICRHQTIICANSSNINFYNGEDLYGIDHCVELCGMLKKDNIDIGFIFCLPKVNDQNYFNKLKNSVKELGIENNFLFITEELEFCSVLKKSHIFVRPTNSDGDSISVREALYLKVPALASDAAKRCEGTILFKTRDINELYKKTLNILQNYKEIKNDLKELKLPAAENARSVLAFYKEIRNGL